MTVVQYEPPPPLPASMPGDELEQGPKGWVARLRGAAEIAAHIADTDFVPQAMRGNAPAIAAAILFGDEVGLTPMQSLAKIAVIKGRPTLNSEAMRSLIAGAGHELWLEESTATRCIAAGRRKDSERVGRVQWTLDDAKRAGIGGGENWRRYPREMLVARATATLARQMFADVIGGLAASEELEDAPDNGFAPGGIVPFAGAVPEAAESPPAPTQRRSRPAASTSGQRLSVAPTPPPDQQPEPAVDPDPAPMEHKQRALIFALMREVGLPTGDREARLAYASRVIGRELASSSDLTFGEASKLIDDLQEIEKLPELERMQRLLAPGEAAVVAELEQLEHEARQRSHGLEAIGKLPSGFTARHYPLTPREERELCRLKAAATMARNVETFVALVRGKAVDLDQLEPSFARNFRRRRELEAR
jgi:hypothetical protein